MADRSELEVKLPIRGMLIGFLVIIVLLILAIAATHIRGMKEREPVVLVLMMLIFSLFGSLLGLLEELVPFVLLVAPLAAASGSSCWA